MKLLKKMIKGFVPDYVSVGIIHLKKKGSYKNEEQYNCAAEHVRLLWLLWRQTIF